MEAGTPSATPASWKGSLPLALTTTGRLGSTLRLMITTGNGGAEMDGHSNLPLIVARPQRPERIWADPDDLAMIGATHDALALLQSKWRVDILVLLASGIRRHARLVDNLPGLTKKVLSATLRSLEEDGLVVRRVYADLPVRIEYGLTPLGWRMTELLMSLYEWSLGHRDELAAASTHRESQAELEALVVDPSLVA
jgi:DNA-binding HxlR family transcriptional regulator